MDEILPESSRKYGSKLAGGHLGPSEAILAPRTQAKDISDL